MSTNSIELFKTLRESQNKYVYFLLASNVAMIGFALKQTSGLALTIYQIPLGISVVLWGLSFMFGCKHVQYVNSSLYSNSKILSIEEGNDRETKYYSPDMIHMAVSGIHSALEYNSTKASFYGNWQYKLLIWGSFSYIVWHVLEMYIATIK
jgi:hypothetical protein